MLVVVDRFSKWVEAFPVGKQSGEAVAQALSKEIIPRFEVPRICGKRSSENVWETTHNN